ncbi:MAG: hypothetical protein LQ341_007048, partial [Variospora aurantia]
MTAKVMRMPSAAAFVESKFGYSKSSSNARRESFNGDVPSLPRTEAGIKAAVADSASRNHTRLSSRSLAEPRDSSPSSQSPTEGLPYQESTTVEDDYEDVDALANRLDQTRIVTAAPDVSRNVE